MRRGGQAVAESQRRIAQDAADRFEEVSRKVAEATRGTSENMRRLMTLPNAAEGGLRDFRQGVTGLIAGVAPGAALSGLAVDAYGAAPAYWVPIAAGATGTLIAFLTRARRAYTEPLVT